MKILVTGGVGDVGRAVVGRLVRNGHQVRVFDRQPGPTNPQVETILGDITHFDDLLEAMRGQEAVAHLAGIRSPSGGTAQEIFQVNDLGTFHVYQAAAVVGIRRVVCASSICALGYLFGCKDFEIRYFPLDEEHPSFTTDPYSFSKQVVEEIAAYFWRREGISSACLRLTAVPVLNEQNRARILKSILYIRQDLETVSSLTGAERKARLDRLMRMIEALRESGSPGRPLAHWKERLPDLSDDEASAISWRNHFWTVVHPEDAAQAFEKSLLADFQGSFPLYINHSQNLVGVDAELLARSYFPGVKARKRPLRGSEALISIERARSLIGFEPEYRLP